MSADRSNLTPADYAAAGLAGLTSNPLYALLATDPQYDSHNRLRNPDQPDTTELNIDVVDGNWVHRDLFAHQFRWGFVGRLIRREAGERILDLGCGSRLPLARTLGFGAAPHIPELYVGVDYGSISRMVGTKKPKPWEGRHRSHFDATDWLQVRELVEEYGLFTLVTSFEVVEHIYPAERVVDYLQNAYRALVPGGRLLLSTPVVKVTADGRKKRARNHIHEWEVPELQAVLEGVGFRVEQRYGTFASYNDIVRAISQRLGDVESQRVLDTYQRCRDFYSDDVLACFLSPMFPDDSRNNMWVCRKPQREPRG